MSNTQTGLSFNDMALPSAVLEQLNAMQFLTPTPIQLQAIPALLEGQDVLGEAQTGTGKTAAFGLPALAKIDASVKQTQVLVVTPTRELAIQVAEALEGFAAKMRGVGVATVYGGAPFGPQVKALKQGTAIVVGTPGRLIDLLNKNVLQLDGLKVGVLDEADEMLNMGFIEDIETILKAVPSTAQRALFSATMPNAIRKLAKTFLKDPLNIQIEAIAREKATIKQKAWKVQGMTKMTALTRLLEVTPYQRALIFVRTRQDTMDVAELLQRNGFKAAPLSGDLNQAQREQTVSQLRSGHIEILVGTDVVARGLDVPEITHVINYDLPSDTESYVHRIGRTGRAGRTGEAILFFRAKERHLLRHYERLTNAPVEFFEVPNANELSKYRQQQLLEKLQASLAPETASADKPKLEKLLGEWLEQSELSAEEIALALLAQHNEQRPLFLKEDRPVREARNERSERSGRNERSDRGDKRKPRAERGGRAADVDFETYKIQVGREHGARPGDIVGAIANEASMDSKYIGQIQLFDNHSLVQLPKGMPKDIMHVLKKARVRQQPMGLELSDEQVKRAPRPPRDRDARGGPKRNSGKGAARRFS